MSDNSDKEKTMFSVVVVVVRVVVLHASCSRTEREFRRDHRDDFVRMVNCIDVWRSLVAAAVSYLFPCCSTLSSSASVWLTSTDRVIAR